MELDRRLEMGFRLAAAYASMSKDPSTQVGCVILGPGNDVRAGGFNGLARGVQDLLIRMDRKHGKYLWTEHAERNAIYNAARAGVSLEGCSLFVTSLPPCADCMRGIIQVGVVEVFCSSGAIPERWVESTSIADLMAQEAGVCVQSV